MKLNNELEELKIELQEQRDLLDTIINSTPDLLLLNDRTSVYQHVNSAFCKFLSKAEDELKITKDDLKIKIDERTAELESAVTLLKNEINDRKKIEHALKESERKYRDLVDYAIVGIAVTSLDGDIFYANNAIIRMLEYGSVEEMGGKSTFLHKDPSGREFIIEMLKKKRNISEIELDLITKTGKTITVLFSAVLERDKITTILVDISKHKHAEESLMIKERAIESSINAICIADNEANINYVNASFIKMWGYDNEEEVLGKSALGFWHHPRKAVDVIKTLNEKGSWVGELNARKKDSTLFDVQLSATIVKDNSGIPLCIMASFLDITESKNAEASLKKAKKEIETWNKELEHRVKEKTNELLNAQSQLIQSEKLSAMGEMAGGLAHELNSPLAGLLPLIEHYKNNAEKDTKTYYEFSLMYKACEYMAKIVSDFSSFSRESKGEFHELNLNEAINDTLNFSISRIKQKGIQLIKEYEDNLPSVHGEKTELQQVILNLITNALDAMTEGGTFNIKTGSSLDNKNIIMEFIDNGIGIKKESLDKIFDPFYTTKRPGKGTGLGLSISYKIIEKHGGKISAESEPGQGTKFIISLPAAESNTI